MKKYLCLVSMLGLCACEFQQSPKCWDEQIKKDIMSNITYNDMSMIALSNIKEVPVRTEKKYELYKNVRECQVEAVFDNKNKESQAETLLINKELSKERHLCRYLATYADTENGREATYIFLSCD